MEVVSTRLETLTQEEGPVITRGYVYVGIVSGGSEPAKLLGQLIHLVGGVWVADQVGCWAIPDNQNWGGG